MLKRLRYLSQMLCTKKTKVAHGDRFMLYRGDDLLGEIVLKAELCDFPWYGGEFRAAPAFTEVEHLFREEVQLLGEENMDAWGKVWQHIQKPGFKLVPVDGGVPVPDPIMHIESGEARWRS